MRCSKCEKEFPSKFYFKVEDICYTCYYKLDEEEKELADAKLKALEKNYAHAEKIRPYWALILFSIFSLGIYFIYWLFVNIHELKGLTKKGLKEKIPNTATVLLLLSIVITILFIIQVTVYSLNRPDNLEAIVKFSIYYSVVITILSSVFMYYFSLTVATTQKLVDITPFKFLNVFSLYLAKVGLDLFNMTILFTSGAFYILVNIESLLSENLSEIMPTLVTIGTLSNIGTVFGLIFLYVIQKEINRIWIEGKLEIV